MLNTLEMTFQNHPALLREGIAVGESYRSRIAGLKFIRIQRMHIDITDVAGLKTINVTGSRCNISYPMDLELYLSQPPDERKQYLFEAVFEIMEELAGMQNWDLAVFRRIHDGIRSAGYIIPISYYPKLPNPALTRFITLEYTYTFGCVAFVLQVYDREGILLHSMPVYRCHPLTQFFSRFFTFKEWVTNDLFVIKDANREIHFVCDLVTGEVVVELHPDVHSEEELLRLLKGLHYTADGAS